ncbi:MAG: hypothetical protein R3249_10505, partial [Nitriliruptorales bacterium]|nr:hypothetical protein [Nitriliruptorales bacterium]
MINHRVQAREYDLAARSERVHGLLRIVGGLAGIGLLIDDTTHPSIVWRGEMALWVFFLLVGAYTVIVTRRRRQGPWIMPFRRLTLAVDAAVLLSQIPIHAYAGTHFDPSPALIVPLLGGIKGGYRLFAWCLAGLVAAEATWAAMAITRFDTPAAAAFDESVLNLVMGAAFGVLAAHLAHTAREGRHRADEEADRAEEAAFRAAAARAEIEALHEVLRSGLGLSEQEAAEAMVRTLSRALEGDVALRISLGDGPATTVSARGLRPGVEDAAVVSMAPISVADSLIGELELRTVGAAPDDAVMSRLADQIAVALTAARQL